MSDREEVVMVRGPLRVVLWILGGVGMLWLILWVIALPGMIDMMGQGGMMGGMGPGGPVGGNGPDPGGPMDGGPMGGWMGSTGMVAMAGGVLLQFVGMLGLAGIFVYLVIDTVRGEPSGRDGGRAGSGAATGEPRP